MAEGHVSHRNAERLTAALGGREIVRVDAGPQMAAQQLPRRLTGDTLELVETRGKHQLIRFTSGRVLHSHLGMNGRWQLRSADRPPPQRRLWLALWTDLHVAAQYGGPRLRLHEPGGAIPALAGVGPDVLDATLDPGQAALTALAGAEPARPVGDVLLDQRLLSGIGNIYRAETLFLAGIDPWRGAATVSVEEAHRIGQTAAELMRHGVMHPGPITTYHGPAPGRERTWVYGRRDQPCRRCGTPVRAKGMGDANRTLFWCPTCQT
jgi:endonuclease-8